MEQNRKNEIAYAVLLVTLGKENLELNPNRVRRDLGNLVTQLPGVLVGREELQEFTRAFLHDLVDYASSFTWKEEAGKKKKSS
ncbi:MAG: hypothetical protein WAV73_05735 [Candidatus Moraniibacteriota bacterium]